MNKLRVFTAFVLTLTAFLVSGQNTELSEAVRNDRARGIILPKGDSHYKRVQYYVENEPDSDYLHASEAAYEAFKDIKFAVRIHWGIYSIREMNGESWGFLKLPDKEKQEYNNLYKTFNPTAFDAQEWMDLFTRSGIKAFAFTAKHHEGFSMYHTKTKVKQRVNYLDTLHVIEPCNLAYSIEETPFKRDIVKELCDAAHKNDIKIDLYYSHPDWYDADFRPYNHHPLTTAHYLANSDDYGFGTKIRSHRILTPEPTAEERARLVARHREQLRELLTNYGKIDMICLDQWLGKNIWPETKETVKMMRRLQPDVMIRCRGIGNYGDYYTPEGFVPGAKENTNMPWMTIRALGSSFSYDKDGSKYKGAPWIIHNLLDAVSKGGNFMVGIGPDGSGRFHPKAIEQLEETGRWLKVNGEGIYGTRAREVWQEGNTRFTQTKDGKEVFAFTEEWPGKQWTLGTVKPKAGSPIYLLGYDKPLAWTYAEGKLKIEIPGELQSPEQRPCQYAWTFRIQQDKIRIACVGNSITRGARASESYPARLSRLLGDGYDVRNFGKGSATLLKKGNHPYWNSEEYPKALAFNPDRVFIKFGTNDSKLSNRPYLNEYMDDCKAMIRAFRELPSRPQITLLLPVPAYRTDTMSITAKVIEEQIIPMIRQVAYEEGCEVVNLFNLMLEMADLFPDTVHPNVEGYAIMADRIIEHVKQASDYGFHLKDVIPPDAKRFNHFGFQGYEFLFKGHTTRIVVPKQTAVGHPWIFRSAHWYGQPQTDIALLERGFHFVHCDIAESFANDEALAIWDELYKQLQQEGLSPKSVMEGMSRGGVYIYRWAAAYPDRVAAVYADAPVTDLRSWPGGKGRSKGAPKTWETFKKDFNLKSDEEAMNFKGSPIHLVDRIVSGKFPMLHVVGDKDKGVPIEENTLPFEQKIREAGGSIQVIHKPEIGHHPHSLPNPQPIVDFILRATGVKN